VGGAGEKTEGRGDEAVSSQAGKIKASKIGRREENQIVGVS
jgi:hypothetical protein